MISLIIGIVLLLCLVGYYVWYRSGFHSFRGVSWLFIIVIIPFVLFIVGAFLIAVGISNLFALQIGANYKYMILLISGIIVIFLSFCALIWGIIKKDYYTWMPLSIIGLLGGIIIFILSFF